MSFAGAMLGCWLAIAAIAFVLLSRLARSAPRGGLRADLGIVGSAELRMLLREHDGEPLMETGWGAR